MTQRHPRLQNDIFISTPRFPKKVDYPVIDEPEVKIISDKANEHISFTEKVLKPRPINRSVYEQIQHELEMHNPEEKIIWIGRSSQVVNLPKFVLCFLFGWLIAPLIIAYIIYLQTKNTIYVVTQERLLIYSGIFTKRIDDLELYRIKDTAYLQPFFYRFFNISSIQLYSSDISWGESAIPGIENGMELREQIRRIVENVRTQKGVSEVDYYTRPNTNSR